MIMAPVWLILALAAFSVFGILGWLSASFHIRKLQEVLQSARLSPSPPAESHDPGQIPDLIRQVDKRTDYVSSVFASMQDAVLFMDTRCYILLYNERATQLLGVGPACLFANPGQTAAGPLAQILEACRRVLNLCQDEHFDLKDAKGRFLSVNLIPVFSKYQNHELLGVLALAEDVTELRKMENLRKEFVANVSHEFRTPLTLIKGIAEMLGFWDTLSQGDRERALALLSVETERLSRLIGEVLMLSEMEHRVHDELNERFDAVALAKEAAESLAPLAEQKHQILTVHTGPSCELEGNARWFFHAVRNLVENAIKYTADAGKIELRTRLEPADIARSDSRSPEAIAFEGESTSVAESRMLIIEVEDNGIGISTADQERIFERFYRVDKSHSSRTGGSGLGLSIANDIVQLHGGRLKVQSAPGKGSMFSIVLPIK